MKNLNLSKRLFDVPASPIRKLVPLANQAKKEGVKIYHLNIGNPDIKSPHVMLRVLKKWNKPQIPYSYSKGNPQLIESLLGYYHNLGFSFLKRDNIQITFGGSEAIFMTLFAIANPGDEVIVFEPFYANYRSFAITAGVKLVPVMTKIENAFHLPNAKEIEKKITKKTKAIFFCNPNNPTGTVYSKEEVEMLVELARKYNLFLLSDEVYREFVFDRKEHFSLFRYMRELPKQLIVLDSLSKRYSLCGARIGMLVSLNKEINDGVLRIAQARLSIGTVDESVAIQLNKVKEKYFHQVRGEYFKRRDLLYQRLKKVPGVIMKKPEGAFYFIVTLPVRDAEKFCSWLLTDFRVDNKTVMLAPASGFYMTKGKGKNQVRVAYVLNRRDLKDSLKILRLALEKYKEIEND